MFCQVTQGPIQRILIECPLSVKAELGGRDRDFETFNGVHCLKLLIQGDQYKSASVYKNGEPGYVRTLNATQFSIRALEKGFDLKVVDPHETLFYLVQRISNLTTSLDRRTKTDLKVFDFLLPEVEDVIIARAATPPTRPFTMRIGAIDPPQAEGGRAIGRSGQGWISGGFTVKFREKKMRLQ